MLNLRFLPLNFFKFHYSTTIKKIRDVPIEKIRNIGILAHIDAGKTTTTERMLYYSGLIQQMGEVHHGNTVTDFMDQERERGITITSAAISFYWRNCQFNLIDTPGHIDFTMEVEQTLNVLDGAVVVLDGSAGVEAQTLTVWRQAERYGIPKVVFVNKMDRIDADIKSCCESIKKKLEVPYLLMQLPVKENGRLVGVIDVLTMEMLKFPSGKEISRVQLTEKGHWEFWDQAKEARNLVIDRLTEFDDELANTVISQETIDKISTADVEKAVRKVTFNQLATPVFLGSAYKNIGVQSLMDAVILYLPPPNVRNQQFSSFEDNFCARAFKVRHDKQKGPLVFLRLYNGSLSKNQRVYSFQSDSSEQTGRLYLAYADDYKEVESVTNGNIAVATGLKKVMSGDLITNSQSAGHKARKNLFKKMGENVNIDDALGLSARVPEPVFFCSIEPPSLATQSALDQALIELQREDPSLRVTQNDETGQTVLAGMGELHLEIIRDRILREYKIEAELGPLQIAYRESPIKKVTDSSIVDTKIGNSRQQVMVRLSLIPGNDSKGELVKFDKSPESASNIAGIYPKHLLAVKQGIVVGLMHGPKLGCQVTDVHIMLHYLEVGRGTSETFITATVTQLVQNMLKQSGTDILEPVMNLEVVASSESVSAIMADLSRRRASINNVGMRGGSKLVVAETPLSELRGYSTILRTISSGTASFSMEFGSYQKMSPADAEAAIREVRGF